MGYMQIKQINTDNIKVKEYYNTYSIHYILDYAKLSSISIKLDVEKIIETPNVYKIFIEDKKSIGDLQLLDLFFTRNIYMYDPYPCVECAHGAGFKHKNPRNVTNPKRIRAQVFSWAFCFGSPFVKVSMFTSGPLCDI